MSVSANRSVQQAAAAAPCANGGNASHPSHKSLDFRHRHDLNWSSIETELHGLTARVMAVEILGRSAVERVHGESLVEVFDFLASDMRGDIERLKELLGLGRESEGVQS